MVSANLRSFLKILAIWIAVYALTLLTWKKPRVPINMKYLENYKFDEAPEWSLEQALEINMASCPPSEVNFDRNAVAGNKFRWADITDEQIFLMRYGLKKYLESAKHDGSTAGRGIVMSAGDSAALERAIVSISLLRHYGCHLPVQIYHYEDEGSRLPQTLIDKLSNLQADVIEVTGLQRGGEWKAYHIKAIVIQRCSFNEILYLDTDTYASKDPTYLFDSEPYKETGVMLWPDFTKSHPTNPVWRFLGIPCRPEYEGESGQILINRGHHQQAMHIAEHFALENSRFYHMMGGDRDSFRIALLAANKKWSGPSRMVAVAGIDRKAFGGHTMMQSDHRGDWLFVHANLLKHSSLPRDNPETWAKLIRVKNDTFVGTYGTLEGNEKLGDGVKLEVSSMPEMFTEYSSFKDDYKDSVEQAWRKEHLVEDWFRGVNLALIEFEALFFQFGGKRL